MNDRRGNPPMPWEEFEARELRTFAKQIVIAFFVIVIPLAILVYPWGQ